MRRLQGSGVIVTIIVVMLLAVAACGGSGDGSAGGSGGSAGSSGGTSEVTDRGPIGLDMVGVWHRDDYPNYTLTFAANGTLVFDNGGTDPASSEWGWYANGPDEEDWYVAIGGTSDGNSTVAVDMGLTYGSTEYGSFHVLRDTHAEFDPEGPVHSLAMEGCPWYKD